MSKKIICLSITVALVGMFLSIGKIDYVSAVTSTAWKAGNIIDDSIFTDKSTMSVDQIQSFLNNKVPNCDTNGLIMFNATLNRAQYSASIGKPAPFTCLKDYFEVPKTSPGPEIPENNFGGKPIPAGAISAAQIIWDAAQQYNISPKVLLVKLGTESAGPLTTDDWPFLSQYTYAMGSHCPDSGPGGSANCDINYSGFSMQIYSAASLLNWYLESMTEPWWAYKRPYQDNNILWNISESNCGGSNVYIENRATAALYTYTPYQPNKAALDNMYGTGDGCSAYGNRNFWRLYNDWFGTTVGQPVFSYTVVSQTAYSDSEYQSEIPMPLTIEPNSNVYLKLVVKNTGNQTWYKGSLRIGTTGPVDRSSIFSNSTWLGANRPTEMVEQNVMTDNEATFKIKLTGPNYLGTFNEHFSLLIESYRWIGGDINIPITVASANDFYSVQNVSFDIYSDAKMTNKINPLNIIRFTSSKLYAKVVLKNTGNIPLPADSTKLAPTNPIDTDNLFSDSSWLVGSRVIAATEGEVLPEEMATYVFSITTPDNPLPLTQLQFGLVVEYVQWLSFNVGTLSVQTVKRPPSSLNENQVLTTNEALLSGDEKYALILQSDGNLVLYSPTRPIWNSGTVGMGGVRLIVQSDGNLVLYNQNWSAVWHSKTDGRGASSLQIQDDGNLVMYNARGFTWASWTVAKT
jgi:hypothetical protein